MGGLVDSNLFQGKSLAEILLGRFRFSLYFGATPLLQGEALQMAEELR